MTPGGLCFANSLAILANAAEPQFTERDLRGAPRVPDWGDFQDYAAGLSHELFDQLEAALAAGKPLSDLEEIRKQIEDLGNQVRVAGLVMGLMIPFKPKPKKTGFIAFCGGKGGKPGPCPKLGKPSLKERNAVADYSTDKFQKINGALRGTSQMTKDVAMDVHAIDSFLEKSPKHSGTVFRKFQADDSLIAQLQEGHVFSDKAFLSTSKDAPKFIPKGSVALQIIGENGVDVSSLSHHGAAEKEVLFPRNSRFKVLKAKRHEHGGWVAILKQIPHDAVTMANFVFNDEFGGQVGLVAFGPWMSWRGIRTLFPWMDAAIDFLTKKKVVPASEFSSLSMDQQQAAFTAPGMEDKDELRKLRDEIAKGQNQEQGGESFADFRKRIADQVSLTRAQTETVFRTNVKQGLVDGFEKSMKSELVSELFPAVLFSATPDNRVRETHWELDGFVCLKTDPAYKVLLRAIKDWNCILPGGTVTGSFLCGVKSFYKGQAVEIETLDGAIIRVTKNHPILTANGFVPAGKLDGSEQLFFNMGNVEECRHGLSATDFSGWTPQKYDVPTKVEDVFSSLAALGFQESLRPISDNFHCEAEFFDGNVSVVWSNRKLLNGNESGTSNDRGDFIFESSLRGGSGGGMGGRELVRTRGITHGRPFEGFGLTPIAGGDAVSSQSQHDSGSGNSKLITDRLDRSSGVEEFDHGRIRDVFPSIRHCFIRSIRHFEYSGEVYDFQTTTGLILLNGIGIGNCRCSLIPLTLEDAESEPGGIRTIGDLRAFHPKVIAKYGQG